MSNPFANAAARTTQPAQNQAQPGGFGGFQGQSTPEPAAGTQNTWPSDAAVQNAAQNQAPAGFGGPVNGFQGQPDQAGQFQGQAQNAQFQGQAPQGFQGQAPQGFQGQAPQGYAQPAQGYAQPAQNPGGNGFAQGQNPGFGAPAADGFATAGQAQPAQNAPATGGDPFASPTGGGGAKVADYLGCLLLVKPLEFISQMQTSIGNSDTIRGDAFILDGPNPGEEVTDMLFFQQALRRDLDRTMRGSSPYLLGRLARGVAKVGKSAPWIFETPTDADAALARQFLAYKASQN